MPDFTFSITVPSDDVANALAGFIKLYPNVEKLEDGKAKYTDAQWVKECVRRMLVRDIQRGLKVIAMETTPVTKIADTAVK